MALCEASSIDQELAAPRRLIPTASLSYHWFLHSSASTKLESCFVRRCHARPLPHHTERCGSCNPPSWAPLPSASPEVQRLLREVAAALTRPQLAAQLLAAALAAPPPPRHPLPQLRRMPEACGGREYGDSSCNECSSISKDGPVAVVGMAARAAAAGAQGGEDGVVGCARQGAGGGRSGSGCALATGVVAELREAAFQVVRDAEEGGAAVLWPGGEALRARGWGKRLCDQYCVRLYIGRGASAMAAVDETWQQPRRVLPLSSPVAWVLR